MRFIGLERRICCSIGLGCSACMMRGFCYQCHTSVAWSFHAFDICTMYVTSLTGSLDTLVDKCG